MRPITVLFLVSFLAIIGCKKDDSSPTQAPSLDISGRWTGTGSDNTGTGTFTFTLTQNGANVNGTWSAKDSQSGITVTGTISGTLSGSDFQGQMTGGALNCLVTASFTASISGSSMSGTYSGTSSCTGPVTNGQFKLTRARTPTCDFNVAEKNGSPQTLRKGWKFWKDSRLPFDYYTVTGTITNLPSGSHWSMYLVDPSGNTRWQILGSQSSATYGFTFSPPNDAADNQGYEFRFTPQGDPTTAWSQTDSFSCSTMPSLSISVTPTPLVATNNAAIIWSVTGGVPGVSDGGWTGNIALQWYKDGEQSQNWKCNFAEIPVSLHTYTFTVPSSVCGNISTPNVNFKIAGANAMSGTSLPPGYVYAFTPFFNIDKTALPSQGLIAYYPFNGNADDEGGNGNHGIVYGASLTLDRFGIQNRAYAFNGLDQFISVLNSSSLNPPSAITLHVWIKTTSTHTNAGIVGKWNSHGSSGQEQYVLQASLDGINFHVKTNNGQFTVTEPTYSDGLWHSFTGVWNGSTLFIYKDGVMKSSTACTGIMAAYNQSLEIGRYAAGQGGTQNYFNGSVDDIFLYNRALSDDEIKVLSNEK